MQIAIDDARREPRDCTDVGAQHFQARLLREPLRNGDDRPQHDGSGQADGPERSWSEASGGGHGAYFCTVASGTAQQNICQRARGSIAPGCAIHRQSPLMTAHPELPRPTLAEPAFAAAMEKGMNVSLWAQ